MKSVGIQRAVLVVRPDRFENACAFFSELLGESLEDIPGADAFGLKAAAAWNVGIEIVSPLPGTTVPTGIAYAEFLQKHGEGLAGAAYLVEDIEEANAKARRLGIRSLVEFKLNEDEIKAIGLEKVYGKAFKEAVYNSEDCYGVTLILNEFGLQK